jgi:signal transduction histidine kinase
MPELTLRRSRSLARLQVAVMVGVTLAFVAGSTIAEIRASEMDGLLDGIVADALPSVVRLAAARVHVNRLDVALVRYGEAHVEERTELATAMQHEREGIEKELASYETLPAFRSEPALFASARAELVELDHELRVLRERTANDEARRDALGALTDAEALEGSKIAGRAHGLATNLDEALRRDADFNAERGERLGIQAHRLRHDVRATMLLMNAVAVALAAVATVLAALVLRRSMRAPEVAGAASDERAVVFEKRSSELDSFAARLAHDVLSPLMATTLALDLVQRRLGDGDDLRIAVDSGLASLLRVRRVVDGLLAYSRASVAPEGVARADVHAALAEVVATFARQAEENEVEIVLASIAEIEARCSPSVVTAIVGHFVANAIQFMGARPIRRVTLRARIASDTRGRDPSVRIEVEDTGPGIPPGLETEVFGPLARGGHERSGLGLGLATSRRLAVAAGGRIGGYASPGGGSVFWCELPLA